MANQTVSTSQSLESVIAGGLSAGQNITINGGAVITMTETNSILVGRITINEGELLIDGTSISVGNSISLIGEGGDSSVDETFTVNGQGKFTVTGDWFSIGTTDATDSQVINLSTANLWDSDNFISWLSMIQIETGRRINFDGDVGLVPVVGDWVNLVSDTTVMGKIQEVGVGYLVVWYLTGSFVDNDPIEVVKVVDNFGADMQVSWTADVNNVLGDIKEAGVYQEFGNCVSDGVGYMSSFHRGVGGFVFEHFFQATTLTLGSSAGTIGGFKAPTGCDIRVPNVMIGSSTVADFASGNCTGLSTTAEEDYYMLECSAGGTISLDVLNVGNAIMADAFAFAFDASYVGATTLGSTSCANRMTFDHCVFVLDPLNTSEPRIRYAPTIQDCVNGADIDFCMLISARINRFHIGCETSFDVNIRDGIISNAGQGSSIVTNTNDLFRSNKSTNVLFGNCVSIGNNNASAPLTMSVLASNNVTIKDFMYTPTQDETQQTNERDGIQIATSNGGTFIGLKQLGGGNFGNETLQLTDLSNWKFRAYGMIDRKVPFPSDSELVINCSGLISNLDFARMWKGSTGSSTEEFILLPATSKDVIVQNCSGDYTSEFQPSGNNVRFRGLHAGNGTPGSITGWEDSFVASFGYNFHDGFRSDTTGILGCLMITPSSSVNETTVIAGNPLFFKDGDLDMKSGDIIEIKQSYFALGHIRFSGGYTATTQTSSWNANEWPNVTLLFKWKSKSGSVWSSLWLDLRNPANLTSIPDFDDGIMLWHRLEATGTQNDMSMLLIDTITTIQAQKDNFYPIDQKESTLTLVGIELDSKFSIYDLDNADPQSLGTELQRDNSSSVTATYVYDNLKAGDTIELSAYKAGFKPYQQKIVLGAENASFEIKQVPETN